MRKIALKQKNRSGKSKCDICNEPTFLDCHHIEGRKIEKCNNINNLANVCQSCHRKLHEEEIIIEGWFQTTMGRELLWHKKGEIGFTEQIKKTFNIPK